MARVRLATRSIPEPLCSLSSWCSGYRFVLPSGFGKFITLGTDEFPGGPDWSWLSSCRALAVAQGPAKSCFCLGARSSSGKCVQVRIRLSLSVSLWDALGYQPSSPAMSLFLTICQLGLWPCLSLGSQFPDVFPFLQLQLHPWQMGKLC